MVGENIENVRANPGLLMDKRTNPAERLEGLTLDGGWSVIEKIQRPSKDSGGNFSVCYLVQNSKGQRAFLNALDYSRALLAPDPALALKGLTEGYIFERDLLYACRKGHMDRVIIALADGTVRFGQEGMDVVQYIIFELADGNVRSRLGEIAQFDIAWSLRALHHIAIGLSQLHGRGLRIRT